MAAEDRWWAADGTHKSADLVEDIRPDITHMVIRDNIPSKLHHHVPNLTHLYIWTVQDSSQLVEIGDLGKLEHLSISGCNLGTLPDSIGRLTNLKTLCLADNKLIRLPDCIGNLRNLEKLSLGINQLSELPSSVGNLSRLKYLDLMGNKLKAIPDSIGNLHLLQYINLGKNLLHELPESIGKLRELKSLYLYENELHSLPDSTVLLQNLTTLSLSKNKLSSLPGSFQKLPLQRLMLADNQFSTLPTVLVHVTALKELDLKRNHSLESVPSDIIKLTNMKLLELDGCDNLHEPPSQVLSKGFQSIKRYYEDLTHGSHIMPGATVAVIGQTMAGKTSLIRTLQQRKRVLTKRGGSVDEATIVFDFEDVMFSLISDAMAGETIKYDYVVETKVMFVDVGGHEVFHPTYKLALKDTCIPLVVVNLEEYQKLAKDDDTGPREAVRIVCFDWLSHFYVACKSVGNPTLAFTHSDMISEDKLDPLIDEFLCTCQSLRSNLLEEESEIGGAFCEMKAMNNTLSPLFKKSNIFVVGNGSDVDVFKRLLDVMVKPSVFARTIPRIWKRILKRLESKEGAFTRFNTLADACHDIVDKEQLSEILSYFHDCGKILWYSSVPNLKHLVFHNISVVRGLLEVLFELDADESMKRRLAGFQPFRSSHDGRRVERAVYESIYKTYRETGIMSNVLLQHIIKTETPFKSSDQITSALAILTDFDLVFGPLDYKGQNCFINPHYTQGYLSARLPASTQKLKMRSEILFQGMSLPHSVYHKMSLSVFRSFKGISDSFFVRINGVYVYHEGIDIWFTHDYKSRKVVLEVASAPEEIGRLWSILLKQISTITYSAETSWSATRHVVTVFCSHCLMLNETHPEREVDPTWLALQPETGRPMAPMMCNLRRGVPTCLKIPCAKLSETDQSTLREYVDNHYVQTLLPDENQDGPASNADSTTTSEPPGSTNQMDVNETAVNLPDGEEHDSDASSTLSEDGDGYLYPQLNEDYKHEIRIRMMPTWKSSIKNLFVNTDKVYPMSPRKRGRALIINVENYYGSNALDMRRKGSSLDVKNMKAVLASLNFELAEIVEDPTAEEILTAVREESHHPHHADYGMFFLCIMTHGGEDEVLLGTDRVGVKLKDICDLLTPKNFRQMEGKPKVVVIQACAGAKRDIGVAGSAHVSEDGEPEKPVILTTQTSVDAEATTNLTSPPQIDNLNVDDLLIMKSSFESYKSVRCEERGSLFIRALVVTLYKHACHRDLYSIFEIVQERVRKESITLAKQFPTKCSGQTPVANKTFTGQRKLYLFPGYDPPSRYPSNDDNDIGPGE